MADASTIGLFFRLILSLGVVIGLMWAAATVLRKRGLTPMPGKRPAGLQVELLARKSLGRNTSIAIVRVGDRSMIVGITEHEIRKLDDADVEDVDLNQAGTNWTVPDGANGSPSAWKAMLDQLRIRTTRR